jgi:hypothetical protein
MPPISNSNMENFLKDTLIRGLHSVQTHLRLKKIIKTPNKMLKAATTKCSHPSLRRMTL